MKIWDAPTRIYHWIQAFIFTLLAFSGFELFGSEQLHERMGILLTVLLIWRLLWGFIGSDTARFASFTPNLSKLSGHIQGRGKPQAGHNPLGALMVLLLLGLLLIQSITGLAISELIDRKALFDRQTINFLKDIHEFNAWALVACISCHILAILLYKLRGKPLVKAMFTGYSDQNIALKAPLKFASNRRAALALIVAVATVILVLKQLS